MGEIAVLFVPGRTGAKALRAARDLVLSEGQITITLIAEVPQAPPAQRCGCSPREYNTAVAAQVANDLERARTRLERAGLTVETRLLLQGREPPFREFVAMRQFEHVLVPRAWTRRVSELSYAGT